VTVNGAIPKEGTVTAATTSTSLGHFRDRVQSRVFGDLPEQIRRLRWSEDQIQAHQRQRLRDLLAHALRHSRFHARRLADLDPARFELADLVQLPVMTKTQLMADFDDVVTDPRLTRAVVDEVVATTLDQPRPVHGRYLCLASGGSSGERGTFVFDADGYAEVVCTIIRPAAARMAASGGLPPGGLTFGMVAAACAVHATGCASGMMEGSRLRFVPAPVTLPLEQIVERLNHLQASAIYGYPSMLARLAAEQRAGRLRVAPVAITSTGETLLPQQRAVIREAFGAPVVNTFGTSEGCFGVSDPDGETITFASDLCILELVDEHDRPVPMGTPSAKVLMTHLGNRVQPLIRYELSDSFVQVPPEPDGPGHLRATVRGRSDEILRFGDVDIHPLVVRTVLARTPEASDYQVRQTPRGLDLAVVATGPLDFDALAGRLRAALAGTGLPDPEVSVRTVAGLERHPQTGKVGRFIPV
jgi:phenylacetate-CoA ligase